MHRFRRSGDAGCWSSSSRRSADSVDSSYGFLRPANQTAVALVLLPPSAASDFRQFGRPATGDGERHPHRCRHRKKHAGPGCGRCQGVAATRSNGSQKARDGRRHSVDRSCRSKPRLRRVVTPSSWPMPSPRAMSTTSVSWRRALRGLRWPPCSSESTLLTQQIKDLQTQIDTVSARIASEGAGIERRPTGYQSVGLTSKRAESGLAATQQRHQPDHERPTCEWFRGEHHADTSEGHCPTSLQVRLPHRSRHHWVCARAVG